MQGWRNNEVMNGTSGGHQYGMNGGVNGGLQGVHRSENSANFDGSGHGSSVTPDHNSNAGSQSGVNLDSRARISGTEGDASADVRSSDEGNSTQIDARGGSDVPSNATGAVGGTIDGNAASGLALPTGGR